MKIGAPLCSAKMEEKHKELILCGEISKGEQNCGP